MSITGPESGEPVRCGASFVDIGTGILASQAVMGALLQRGRTGRGQYLEVSLLGTAIAFLGYHAEAYLMNGTAPQRRGTSHPSVVPYRSYPCGDGSHVFIAAGNQGLWDRLCAAVGMEHLAEDERFTTLASRVENREVVDDTIEEVFGGWDADELIQVLRDAGVPASPVQDVGTFMEHEQVSGSPFLSWQYPDGTTRERPTLGPILDAPDMQLGIDQAAPMLGADTERVLCEAGLSAEDFERLLSDGVVSQWQTHGGGADTPLGR